MSIAYEIHWVEGDIEFHGKVDEMTNEITCRVIGHCHGSFAEANIKVAEGEFTLRDQQGLRLMPDADEAMRQAACSIAKKLKPITDRVAQRRADKTALVAAMKEISGDAPGVDGEVDGIGNAIIAGADRIAITVSNALGDAAEGIGTTIDQSVNPDDLAKVCAIVGEVAKAAALTELRGICDQVSDERQQDA